MAKQRRRDRRLQFLVVARTASGPYPHPVEVAIHPAGADSRVWFSVGPHAANAGGQVALSQVLDHVQTGLNPMFEAEFDAADLHWLVPYLVRLRSGEDVTAEIAEAHAGKHGHSPDLLLQERYGA